MLSQQPLVAKTQSNECSRDFATVTRTISQSIIELDSNDSTGIGREPIGMVQRIYRYLSNRTAPSNGTNRTIRKYFTQELSRKPLI